MNKPKRPRDVNQLAKSIVDLATQQNSEAIISMASMSSYASELGRLGGLKGGKARAKALTGRSTVKNSKKLAAKTRWGTRGK